VLLVTTPWIFMYENSSLFVRALVTFFDWVAYSMKLGSLPVSLAEFIENVCIGKYFVFPSKMDIFLGSIPEKSPYVVS
jgi:hypothetical protein